MTRLDAIELAEKCGFSWLTAKDYDIQLQRLATCVEILEREACAKTCEVAEVDSARECAALIRLRK